MKLALWMVLGLAAQELETGTLEGTVTTRGGKPLADVFVVATTAEGNTQTDPQGHFVLKLPPGVHTLTLLHAVHGTHEVETADIQPNATTTMTLALDVPDDAATAAAGAPATVQSTAEAVTITAPVEAFSTPPAPKATIVEKLDAAAVTRSGDSDAGGALRRVTGLSLVGGRYVYVRGLGERYSSTLLNGATLPSPEPERRVVPMDVFPTVVIDSLTIHKTFSPELPGEFGGGTVDIRTRGIPEKFTLKANASLGVRTGTTFQRGLSYRGGNLDVLGVDDGTRALPSDVRRASDKQPLLERDQFSKRGYTAPQLEAYGKQMPNIWSAERMVMPPTVDSAWRWGTATHWARWCSASWVPPVLTTASRRCTASANTWCWAATTQLRWATTTALKPPNTPLAWAASSRWAPASSAIMKSASRRSSTATPPMRRASTRGSTVTWERTSASPGSCGWSARSWRTRLPAHTCSPWCSMPRRIGVTPTRWLAVMNRTAVRCVMTVSPGQTVGC